MVFDVLGHASIVITKDVCGHLMEGDERAATEAMSNALLGKQRGGSPRWLRGEKRPGDLRDQKDP
ncbi:hypothetical protein GCM10023194_46210 [Planotetraspora phitsanulokensis]|uniref:Integrase n=1 Tax=Planotetraspora phitsanulokensis TaxID=575192 RepID=A0A8J3UA35_9ACTN|nr:hypothetical protein Pph01_60680 [Planotetraspora phitsanulokensis]